MAHVTVTMSAARVAGKSSQTVKHIKNVIGAVLRHAKTLRWLTGDLATEGMRKLSVTHKERQALTWPQVVLLSQQLADPIGLLVLFLAVTGLRIGEATGLRWKYLNLESDPVLVGAEYIAARSLAVKEAYVRGRFQSPKSAKSTRYIPIPGWLAEMLSAHRIKAEFFGSDDPVFACSNGRPLDQHNIAKRHLKRAAVAAGMGREVVVDGEKHFVSWVSWHSLRHTNASLTDQGGLTATERMRILGHSETAMTMHYSHADMEVVRGKLEKMQKPN
jgi:integrase